MKNQIWIAIGIFVLGICSCSLPADQATETPAPTVPPTLEIPITSGATPTLVAIETLLAIDTATIVPTSTASHLLASAKDQPVHQLIFRNSYLAVPGDANSVQAIC